MFRVSAYALAQQLLLTLRRFPLSVACSVAFTAYALDRTLYAAAEEKLAYYYVLFCGCFWFISVQLWVESKEAERLRAHAAAVALFGVLAWYWLLSLVSPLYHFAFLGPALFLMMFFAPFTSRQTSSLQFWTFACLLWQRIGFTLLSAIVLYLGGAAIVSSLEYLFGLTFYSGIYEDWWIITATLFSPLVAMAGIPSGRVMVTESRPYPAALRWIITYLAIPMLAIYALILYAYMAKILVTWTLPQGGVAYLVMSFGGAGILVYLVAYPLAVQQHPLVARYARLFFPLLVLPLGLLAIAIGVRLREYGLTEERYAVVLCLVWMIMAAALGLRQDGQFPKRIYGSVVLLLVMASFGPWGAVSWSEMNQTARLKSVLESVQILRDGAITPVDDTKLERADRDRISAGVDYLVNTRKFSTLRTWFPDLPKRPMTWETDASAIVARMGVTYINTYDRQRDPEHEYFEVSLGTPRLWDKPFEVRGYDYAVTGDLNGAYGFKADLGDNVPDAFRVSLSFDPKTNVYSVRNPKSGKEVRLDLTSIVNEKEKKGILEAQNDEMRVKLYLYAIYGKMEDSRRMVTGITAYLLIDVK